MSKLLHSFWFASRSLRQKPAYLVVCVALLAFTTGALTVMAALVHGLLLRPPTARAPDELVFVGTRLPWTLFSRPSYLQFREQNHTFETLFACDSPVKVDLRFGGQHLERTLLAVSGNFFSALGLPMLRGRGLLDSDDREVAPNVAVITAELSGELGIDVGSVVELNSQPVRIVGVLEGGYEPLARDARSDLWIAAGRIALFQDASVTGNPDRGWLHLVGRLRPGVSPEQALADLGEIRQSAGINPAEPAVATFELQSLLGWRIDSSLRARTALLLAGAVVLLFVLACANLYGLTQLRWFGRRREVALRLAMGATRAHIAAWRLGELCGVVALGVLIAGALAAAGVAWLRDDPTLWNLLATHDVRMGREPIATAVVANLTAGALVWLFGIVRIDDGALLGAIKETASAPRRRRGLIALLGAELAIALGLLVLCFAFVGTLAEVIQRHIPFKTTGVYYARADVRALGWFNDRSRSNAFYQSVIDRLEAVDGVKAAGLANYAPLAGAALATILVDESTADGVHNLANNSFVSPGYFAALGLRFWSGRSMSEAELAGEEYVAVVNRAFTKRYWPHDADVIGKTFKPWPGVGQTPIVGVVDDVPIGLELEVAPHFYFPFTTTTLPWVDFVVQLEHNSAEERAALSRALASIWPNDAPPTFRPIVSRIEQSIGNLVTSLRVTSWVALLAMLVVACGVYFLSAFVTSQSLRDSAVQLALGASFWRLAREHVWVYRWSLFGGLGLGSALLLALAPVLERLQLTLQPPGVLALLAGSVSLGAVTLLGLCVPLWPLRRLDLVSTLGSD